MYSQYVHETACILRKMRRFDASTIMDEIWHPDDINFYDMGAFEDAVRTAYDIIEQFEDQDNEFGFLIFLRQLRLCNLEMDSIIIWTRNRGYADTELPDFKKCPERVNVLGLLNSLPTVFDPVTGLYEQRTVVFARRFMAEYVPPFLKHMSTDQQGLLQNMNELLFMELYSDRCNKTATNTDGPKRKKLSGIFKFPKLFSRNSENSCTPTPRVAS